jgi:uncharacterized protein (DUF2141 family)
MNSMARSYLRILLLLSLASIATPSLSQGVNLTVDNIRNGAGNVVIVVFDEKRAFENLQISSAIAVAELPAKAGRLTHSFPTLNTGPYAVFLFHDENADEDLNVSGNRLLEGAGATGASRVESEPNFLQASVYPGPVNVKIFYEK